MYKELFEVTKERFHLKNPEIYILQGTWPKEAGMEAFLDDRQVETRIEKLEIVSAMERFRDPDRIRGERVTAQVKLPADLSGCQRLRIYADTPDRKFLWFSISAKELEKKRNRPQFFLEEEKVQPGCIRLRGWAVADGPVQIRLFDQDKKPVKADIQRMARVDVEQLYEEMENPDKTGFFIELTDFPGKRLYLVFSHEGTRSVYTVPLRKPAILAKKAEKYAKKGVRYLKCHGTGAFAAKVFSKAKHLSDGPDPYPKWLKRHLPTKGELEKERRTEFDVRPKISIVVPLYKTPEKYLSQLIESVKGQTYPNWELCFSDGSGADTLLKPFLTEAAAGDARIRVCFHERALQISENTNEAIRMATGDYIAFADHDDVLEAHALFSCVKAINANPKAKLLYSDEDKMSMDGHKFFQPHFKPDYNPVLLCTVNYICHLLAVKKELIEQAGLLDSAYDGAQDYDFIFRCVETLEESEICHIPKILYHWRSHENSTAENPESKAYAFQAGKRAIEAHYRRTGIDAEVYQGEFPGLYRTRFHRAYDPLVSILIPNKDHIDDLKRCMESIDGHSTYQNYEYVILENNSTDEKTFQYYRELERTNPKARVVYWNGPFNFSAINNFGVSQARGEYLLLLNNDTQVINEDCLEELLGYCMCPGVGAVGARLYYEDDTIQHAGVVIGFGGIAGHCFVMQPRGTTGYCHRIICAQNYSAVTAACMMVKKSAYEQAGGLTEELAVAFNDIDFCLKLRRAGYLIVYNPYAELYHYESKSRGLEDTPEKLARFNREMAIFEKRWPDILRDGDPYYNPNLTLKSQDFSLKRI